MMERHYHLPFSQQLAIAKSQQVAAKSLAAVNSAANGVKAPAEPKARPTSTGARTVRRASCSKTQSSDASTRPASTKPQATTDTLDIALRGQYSSRQPKPRSSSTIDEQIWSNSEATAIERLEEKFAIAIHKHYSSMCALGQYLLVQEISREAHGIYDFRVSKQLQRAKRRAVKAA